MLLVRREAPAEGLPRKSLTRRVLVLLDGSKVAGQEILPAVTEARALGMQVEGPIPADTIFSKMKGGRYDAVSVMYRDQGHIPTKLVGFEYDDKTGTRGQLAGVNVTLGLRIIRTSVDHGTANPQSPLRPSAWPAIWPDLLDPHGIQSFSASNTVLSPWPLSMGRLILISGCQKVKGLSGVEVTRCLDRE